MMQINLQSKNMELTEAIKEYALKRVTNLEKLLSGIENRGGEVKVNFELSKMSNHHKSGEIFRASCLIKIDGKEFYADSEAGDMYATIDEVKEKLFNDIERNKDRKQTLFKRGALSVKKMLKGLTKRNPFTSKY